MRKRWRVAAVMAATVCTASWSVAQDVAEVSPDIYTILFENDDIRVLEVAYQPGERDNPHSHPSYAVLVLESGTLRSHAENGDVNEINAERGQVTLLDPVERHWAENVGDTTVRAIAVEFKISSMDDKLGGGTGLLTDES